MSTKSSSQKFRYDYVTKNPMAYRILYFVTFIAWILSAIGLLKFFDLSLWYWIFMAPLFVPVLYSRSLTYFINIFYPGFSLEDHEAKKEKFWKDNNPSVDIFLPIAGEPVSLVRETWEAVAKLNYDNYKVYVLEDKVDLNARKLAKDLGFNYLSRPNKGYLKKAGNMEYGYDNSDGEFIVVLDADFVPDLDFIQETIPYFENKHIGLLQTPQYFETSDRIHKRSPIEYGAGNVVEDFYRIVQPARDFFGAAICVGTNSIVRRSAHNKTTATKNIVENAEDVANGLNMIKHGYEIKYIPLILARGICPDNPESYFKQHNRWASGSIMILFSSFFWRIKMTLMQRLTYVSGGMYYIAEAASLIIAIQLFILLIFHQDSIVLGHFLWFVPYLIIKTLIIPRTKVSPMRRGTILAALVQVYTYLYATFKFMLGSSLEWVPTNAKTTSVSSSFVNAVWVSRFILVAWLGMVIGLFLENPLLYRNLDAYTSLIWILMGLIVHGYFSYTSSIYIWYTTYQAKKYTKKRKTLLERMQDSDIWKTLTPKKIFASKRKKEKPALVGYTQLTRQVSFNLLIFSIVFFASSAILYSNNNEIAIIQEVRERIGDLPGISGLDTFTDFQ